MGVFFTHCAVSGTTLFLQWQSRSEFLKLAYFRNCCIVCTQHGLTKPNWEDSRLSKQNLSGKYIPHSFVSKISNKIVLEQSGRQEILSIVTYRQLLFFLGKKLQLCPSLMWGGHACFLVKPFGPGLLNSRSPEDAQGIPRGLGCTNLQPLWSRVLTLRITRPACSLHVNFSIFIVDCKDQSIISIHQFADFSCSGRGPFLKRRRP